MSKVNYDLKWRELAFSKSKKLPEEVATFIAAPRKISQRRLTQLVKEYLPKGNLVIGLSEEGSVSGFEEQLQFQMLERSELAGIQAKVNANSVHKLYTLTYSQPDLKHLIKPLKAKKYVFIWGSWKYTFHTQPAFYELVKRKALFEYASAFADDDEAQRAADQFKEELSVTPPTGSLTTVSCMEFVQNVATASFDPSFQVGAVLMKKQKDLYTYVSHSHNKVVPYETYAMHKGFAKENALSPSNDLNHFDTVHAETSCLINSGTVKGTSLFVNVMPCPTCARAIVDAGVSEVFYGLDHSAGYALKLFIDAGIYTERIVL